MLSAAKYSAFLYRIVNYEHAKALRNHNRFTFTTSIVLFYFISFLISGCSNDIKDIEALTSGRPNMMIDRAEKITAIYSKDGKFKMRIYANEFVRNMGAKPAYIDLNRNLKIEFYNDSGIIDNILTADSCRYYETQGNILIWDSVEIIRKKTGERLNTSELVWNQSIQKFFTEKPVLITTATEVMHGSGMEANQDFTWYQITNPNGTVKVNKTEVPQ